MKKIPQYGLEAGLFIGIFLLLFLSYAAQREPTNFIYYNF
jgi:hypothetical protein